MYKQQHGFTLLEMLIVMAVIVTLSALGLTSYRSTRTAASVADLQSKVISAVELAKAEAAVRSTPIGCRFIANGVVCFAPKAGADLADPDMEFENGLVKESADIETLLAQERYNSTLAINIAPADGILPTGSGIFYFQSDGSVLSALNQPTHFRLALAAKDQPGTGVAVQIRSTGAIVKER